MADLVTREDMRSPKCGECGMTATEHRMFGSVRLLCSQTPDMIRRSHWERVVRREIIAELLGAADEWDALEAKGYDPLSPAEIAGNLRARVDVIRNG